jgi:hypothetical protein
MCRPCSEPTFLPRSTTVEGFEFSQATQRRYHLEFTCSVHTSLLINPSVRRQWFYSILLTLYLCGKNRFTSTNLWRQAIDRCNWRSREPKLKQKGTPNKLELCHYCTLRMLPITKQQYLSSLDLTLSLETKKDTSFPDTVNSLARLTGCCMIECARAGNEMSSNLRSTSRPPILTNRTTVMLT